MFSHKNLFDFTRLPYASNCGDVSLFIFLRKNEAKKSTSLSNRFAFKGVRDVKAYFVRSMGHIITSQTEDDEC